MTHTIIITAAIEGMGTTSFEVASEKGILHARKTARRHIRKMGGTVKNFSTTDGNPEHWTANEGVVLNPLHAKKETVEAIADTRTKDEKISDFVATRLAHRTAKELVAVGAELGLILTTKISKEKLQATIVKAFIATIE